MESGSVLLSRAFASALLPPLAARACSPSQVQCRTYVVTARARRAVSGSKRKTPHIRGVLSFWNPAVSYSPGRSAMASLRPQDAAMASPSQVQCCTLAGHGLEKRRVDWKRKMTQLKLSHSSFGIRQCPTLPGRHQPSTIGAERLNFCVRYGNRWIPFAITTGMP